MTAHGRPCSSPVSMLGFIEDAIGAPSEREEVDDQLDNLARRLFATPDADALHTLLTDDPGFTVDTASVEGLLLHRALIDRCGHPLLLAAIAAEAGRRAGLPAAVWSSRTAWFAGVRSSGGVLLVDASGAGAPPPERVRCHCAHEIAFAALLGLERRSSPATARRARTLRKRCRWATSRSPATGRRRCSGADLAAPHEPADGGHQLDRLVVALVGGGADDAVVRMVVEQAERDLVQRRLSGADLGEDVDAVAVVGDHPLDAADLPLHPAKAREQLVLGRAVAAALLAHGRPPSKLRSRSALMTTDTLDRAMASPAMTGLSSPAAASGMAATL